MRLCSRFVTAMPLLFLAAAALPIAGCKTSHPHAPEIEFVDGEQEDYFNELLQPVSHAGALLSTASVEDLQALRGKQQDLLGTYRLEYGDRFSIVVLDHPEWSSSVTVMPDGNIYFGFLEEPLEVVGQTLSDARRTVVESLQPYFFEPQVKIEDIVQADTSSTVKVIGAVNNPGRVRILPGFRLWDAISDAGGVRTFADRSVGSSSAFAQNAERLPPIDWRRATVQREAQYLPEEAIPPGVESDTDLCVLEVDFLELIGGNAQQNIPLFPGDVIYIPQFEPINNRVVVAGKVRSPGVYYYRESLSLVESLARAGWMIEEEAAFRGVWLVRNSRDVEGDHRAYRLNAVSIVKGRARDIMLRDGDIIYVDSDSLHDINVFISKVTPLFNFAERPLGTYERYRDFRFTTD